MDDLLDIAKTQGSEMKQQTKMIDEIGEKMEKVNISVEDKNKRMKKVIRELK